MMPQATRAIARHATTAALVNAALADEGGLTAMLKHLASALDAFGCAIWELAPGAKLDIKPPQGQLFILASWFTGEWIYARHDLPVYPSRHGEVLLKQAPSITNDIANGDPQYLFPILVKHKVNRKLSVPLTFRDSRRAVVTVYRRSDDAPFVKGDLQRLQLSLEVVPALYESMRQRVQLKVLYQVDKILHDAEEESQHTVVRRKGGVLDQVCSVVGEAMHCIEVSVFLHEPADHPKEFRLMATTWGGEYPSERQRAGINEGVTAYVLETGESVHIFDLRDFQQNPERSQAHYRGITWRDSLDFQTVLHRYFGVQSDELLPPLSFMAAPILAKKDILGVIRCCTAHSGPYYFSQYDLELLQIVAAQVSRWRKTWLDRDQLEQENQSWAALSAEVARLNRLTQQELDKAEPNEDRIFGEALKLILPKISGATGVAIVLDDGRAYERSEPVDGINLRPQREWEGEIRSGDQRFGRLFIRGYDSEDLRRRVDTVINLLGRQFGLYHYLVISITRLRSAEARLTIQIQEQARAGTDLAHQLKGPLHQVQQRAAELLSGAGVDRVAELELKKIRGVARKAYRVARNAARLADLSIGKSLVPKHELFTEEDLRRYLIESAQDAEIAVDPRRSLRFMVDKNSLSAVSGTLHRVGLDMDLFELAVSNILENAGKYSYERTTVHIYVGLTATGRFHLTVANNGIRLRPNEVAKCRERGWRGEDAEMVTGEGSGIGLWIVDHIMRAHGGDLVAAPTNDDGVTEFKLVFPLT